MALTESGRARSGGEYVLARLSELLFIDVVRQYCHLLPTEDAGRFAPLQDDCVRRALRRLHDRPEHRWTLRRLAREAGTSRSVLAERFAHCVGVPVMRYLTRLRIQLAGSLLTSTAASLGEVASRVGYSSEASLSRAFKREMGVPPAAYRVAARGHRDNVRAWWPRSERGDAAHDGATGCDCASGE